MAKGLGVQMMVSLRRKRGGSSCGSAVRNLVARALWRRVDVGGKREGWRGCESGGRRASLRRWWPCRRYSVLSEWGRARARMRRWRRI